MSVGPLLRGLSVLALGVALGRRWSRRDASTSLDTYDDVLTDDLDADVVDVVTTNRSHGYVPALATETS